MYAGHVFNEDRYWSHLSDNVGDHHIAMLGQTGEPLHGEVGGHIIGTSYYTQQYMQV